MRQSFINIWNHLRGGKQTINHDVLFTSRDVLSEIIQRLTRFQVSCICTTEYRELSGFQNVEVWSLITPCLKDTYSHL
uniref:Uncharacterized protein n=1 Tax=Caudovirales sp. ctSH72 TaxID=2826773 RepID=A0A8S5QP80_9CAUD|nr:MAG TPA: hypothetical protein [Caudovirales sp. ctSH72]